MISVRLATPDDLSAFARREPPDWCIEWLGYVAERDGRLLALGSVFWDKWGRVWGAFDKKERVSPFLMHRLARVTITRLREIGIKQLYAECDLRVPNAAKWLRRLGFRPAPIVPPDPRQVWICTLSN